jgi:hypothetical protein
LVLARGVQGAGGALLLATSVPLLGDASRSGSRHWAPSSMPGSSPLGGAGALAVLVIAAAARRLPQPEPACSTQLVPSMASEQ